MLNWIINLLKGKRHTASELVKDIVKRLEIELKYTSDFSSQMEKLKLLFGEPSILIKILAEDGTINASKTPEFNKYFGGISDILASILWLIKKIRKNNEIFSLELKELTRLDEGNSIVYNNLLQITSNFEKYLKKILIVFSKMQKMSIEGNIAGRNYKYRELAENLEKLRKIFNTLSNKIEYCKKMLQENKAVLEEIVDKYRANLEAKGSYLSPSLVRWILITSFSISAALGCGTTPTNYRQPSAQYGQAGPGNLEETSIGQIPSAIQEILQRPIELEPVYSGAYVGEKFVYNLDEPSKGIKGIKKYYTIVFFSENVDTGVEIKHEGLTYNKIKGNQIVYTPKKIEVGQIKRIPVIIKTERETYKLDLILKVGEKTRAPKGIDIPYGKPRGMG